MTPLTVFRLVLGACAAAVVAGGTWLALLGGDVTGTAVKGSGQETSVGAPVAQTSATVAPVEDVSRTPAVASAGSPRLDPTSASVAATETPGTAAVESAPPAPKVARPGGPTPVPTPTQAPPVTDLPSMTADDVLALSRKVQLPSGKSFEACGAIGPEGEPWPFSVHLYYTGHGGWVVATHRGDVALLFDEAMRKFQVDTVTRPGC